MEGDDEVVSVNEFSDLIDKGRLKGKSKSALHQTAARHFTKFLQHPNPFEISPDELDLSLMESGLPSPSLANINKHISRQAAAVEEEDSPFINYPKSGHKGLVYHFLTGSQLAE